jgi:hypothetical protein
MVNDTKLMDPPEKDWDTLFFTDQYKSPIHGVLKVAGSSATTVDEHLGKILHCLKGHEEKSGNSLPTPTTKPSRVEGWTRPNHHGKEQ